MAPECELVIVVGSRNSSNSVRLVEVALNAGSRTSYLVDYADDIDPAWFSGVTTVGVTSGASVPEILVRGGELDGHRVLTADTLRRATAEARRLRPDLATGLQPMRWGTGYMLGSAKYGPFGRNNPASFGHTGLVDIAVWADPARGLAASVVSSGKPGQHREAHRYPALLNRINAEIPAV